MAKKDYYETLGVARNANTDDIRKAYKRLAKQYHPDLNKSPDASEKFKEINEAASVLGDDKKRAHYDRYGTSAQGTGAGDSGFDFRDATDFGFDFDEIFNRFFRGGSFGGQRRRSGRGSDLRYDLEITLEEAARGVRKTIVLEKPEICPDCSGTGAKDKSDIKTCDTCHGTGFQRQTRQMPFGVFTTSAVCNTCGGQGSTIKNPCKKCRGAGRIEKEKKLEIEIPAGIEDEMRLRMNGEGEAGEKGAPPGDLYIVVNVLPHKLFEREGPDINLEIQISFAQAAIGAEIDVPTLDGKAKLKIPQGTQPGTVFRMKGKGLHDLQRGGVGSENVTILVEVPTKLSSKQKKLLEEFDRENQKDFKMF